MIVKNTKPDFHAFTITVEAGDEWMILSDALYAYCERDCVGSYYIELATRLREECEEAAQGRRK